MQQVLAGKVVGGIGRQWRSAEAGPAWRGGVGDEVADAVELVHALDLRREHVVETVKLVGCAHAQRVFTQIHIEVVVDLEHVLVQLVVGREGFGSESGQSLSVGADNIHRREVYCRATASLRPEIAELRVAHREAVGKAVAET